MRMKKHIKNFHERNSLGGCNVHNTMDKLGQESYDRPYMIKGIVPADIE